MPTHKTGEHCYKFTDLELVQLKACKLLAEQISRLEKVIPKLKLQRMTQPKLTEVRDHLYLASQSLVSAAEALANLGDSQRADGSDAARKDAWNNILKALRFEYRRRGLRQISIDRLIDRMLIVSQVLSTARARAAKRGQSRHQAPVQTIKLINDALQYGFYLHHRSAYGSFHKMAIDPKVRIRPAVSSRGDFSEVVRVCFDAAGIEFGEERVIKRFIQLARQKKRTKRRLPP